MVEGRKGKPGRCCAPEALLGCRDAAKICKSTLLFDNIVSRPHFLNAKALFSAVRPVSDQGQDLPAEDLRRGLDEG
jgi:hypothetical protein